MANGLKHGLCSIVADYAILSTPDEEMAAKCPTNYSYMATNDCKNFIWNAAYDQAMAWSDAQLLEYVRNFIFTNAQTAPKMS